MNKLIEIQNKIRWEKYYDPEFDWRHNIDYIEKCLEDKCFINEFKPFIPWDYISYVGNFTSEAIYKTEKYLNWRYLSYSLPNDWELIKRFHNRIDWTEYFRNPDHRNYSLLYKIAARYKNEIDWDELSQNYLLEFDFLKRFKTNINWDKISAYYKITEELVLTFHRELNWKLIKSNTSFYPDKWSTATKMKMKSKLEKIGKFIHE